MHTLPCYLFYLFSTQTDGIPTYESVHIEHISQDHVPVIQKAIIGVIESTNANKSDQGISIDSKNQEETTRSTPSFFQLRRI